MKLILPALGLAFLSSTAFSDVIIPSSDAIQGTPGASGLVGSVYHDGSAQLGNLGTIGSGGYLDYIRSTSPDDNYVATTFNYGTNDTTTTAAFLGGDSNGTAALDSAQIHTTVFDAEGYLQVLTAGTYTFTTNSDDGSMLYIGATGPGNGLLVVSNDGSHGNVGVTGTATFSAPGFYPIEIAYFNQDFQGGSGGAELSAVTYEDPTATSAPLYQTVTSVPEPTGLAAVAGGLAILLGARRRRPQAANAA